LAIASGSLASPTIDIAASASLTVGTGAESGLNLSRLTFNNYSALNLGLTPSAADPANAINVTKNTGDGGVLNLGNIDLTVNTLERGFDSATYTLIKANTLNCATGNIMTATAPGTRTDVTATVDPVAKKVKLAIVQNSRDLTWNSGMGFWDVNIHPYGEWVDNENPFMGYDDDSVRISAVAPLRDRRGVGPNLCFGSAHSSTCNFVFCDGSVHAIAFAIDEDTFSHLGNRRDRVPVDSSKWAN
jgi:prepilin-type processing-associated H-X9-DG protein